MAKASAVKVSLSGKADEVLSGLRAIERSGRIELSSDGIPVSVRRSASGLTVELADGRASIEYRRRIDFFRALGHLIGAVESGSVRVREEPQFESSGVMFDLSRNAVLTTESLMRYLEILALMGIDRVLLYLEDTYKIPGEPYFGYMRGRYTAEELRRCDDHANDLGIELVPCIQTLGHLKQALKWDSYSDVRDTDDVLLAGSDATYELLKKMISSVSGPFRTRTIHIGMDEAHRLGLGRYLALHGYRRRFDIMNEHLNRVRRITHKLGLEPMIWGDMYFRLASASGGYYDMSTEVPSDVAEQVPADIRLVYWDYYHDDPDVYAELIRRHRKFGTEPVFAGGVWTWNGLAVNTSKTLIASRAAISACKRERVREVFATLWGDDGAETNLFAALPGLQFFAEHSYHDVVDESLIAPRFTACTGANYTDFVALGHVDDVPGHSERFRHRAFNPSKYLLFQDPLVGLFDRHAAGLHLRDHYETLAQGYSETANRSPEWAFLFEASAELARVLSVKATLGTEIRASYLAHDLEHLRTIANRTIPHLEALVESLRVTQCRQWFTTNKAFGWEVLDIRYGGLIARLRSSATRLQDFLTGSIDRIEELEADRLPYDTSEKADDPVLLRCNKYTRIVSACPF